MANSSQSPGPGYVWVPTGAGGDDPSGSGYWMAPSDPNTQANYQAGAAASNWKLPMAPGPAYFESGTGNPWVTPGLQRSMNQFFSTPTSGYGDFLGKQDYGAQLARWQFSNSAPVPSTAPVGWGRYPGVGGSPPPAKWVTNPGGYAGGYGLPAQQVPAPKQTVPYQLGTNYTMPLTQNQGGSTGGGAGAGGTLPVLTAPGPGGGPGGYGNPTEPLVAGQTLPVSEWKPAGRTESGVGSTQYPIYSETSQYKAPAGADSSYGAQVPAVINIGGQQYEVNIPEGSGWETMLRTTIAAAGGGPGVRNVSEEDAKNNAALLFNNGQPVANWGLLGTVTPAKGKKEGGR